MLRRLKFARLAANLTQADVAREMGVIRQTVSCWERGLNSPGLEEMAALCALYGVSADQIFYGQHSVRFTAHDLQQIVGRHSRDTSPNGDLMQ